MKIIIDTIINAPLNHVWKTWVSPEDIVQWNHASAEWICPNAKVELKQGGGFNYRMEAKDGSMGFDFTGEFTAIETNKKIQFVLEDGRQGSTTFAETASGIKVEQSFDAEDEHSAEQQKQGWQAILNNFKQYVERNHN